MPSHSAPPSGNHAAAATGGGGVVSSLAASHDEYIDYSCSTSIERLARDVETVLRQWHVDQYSDRHAVRNNNAGSTNSSTNTHAAVAATTRSSTSSGTGTGTDDNIRNSNNNNTNPSLTRRGNTMTSLPSNNSLSNHSNHSNHSNSGSSSGKLLQRALSANQVVSSTASVTGSTSAGVSVHSGPSTSTNTVVAATIPSGAASTTSSVGTGAATITSSASLMLSSASSSPLLIRSEELNWTMSFYRQSGDRLFCPMQLRLALWDGPPRQRRLKTEVAAGPRNSKNRASRVLHNKRRLLAAKTISALALASAAAFLDEGDHDDDDDDDPLPYSLRRAAHAASAISFEDPVDDNSDDNQQEEEESKGNNPKQIANNNGDDDDNDQGMELFLFDNFSALFGIGQHITLTPMPRTLHDFSCVATSGTNTNNNNNNNTSATTTSQSSSTMKTLPQVLLEHFSQSISMRHQEQAELGTATPSMLNRGLSTSSSSSLWTKQPSVAQAMLSRTLTLQLQTALNLAATSAQCCIPVVGIWGWYDASAESTSLGPTRSSSTSVAAAASASLSILPAWMQAPHTLPLRLTRHKTTNSSKARRRLFRNNNKGNKSSSSTADTNSADMATHCLNAHALPDVISGQLFGAHGSGSGFGGGSSVHATMSCAAVTGPASQHVFQHGSLAAWGAVLLQHARVAARRDGYSSSSLYRASSTRWTSTVTSPQSVGSPGTASGGAELDAVDLWMARHVYAWYKRLGTASAASTSTAASLLLFGTGRRFHDNEWRKGNRTMDDDRTEQQHKKVTTTTTTKAATTTAASQLKRNLDDKIIRNYRSACRAVVVENFERAAGATEADPLWGPPDDPIGAVHLVVTWNGTSTSNNSSSITSVNGVANIGLSEPTEQQQDVQLPNNITRAREGKTTRPILSFPLKTRSRRKMSPEDWTEMNDSLERAVLDPLRCNHFRVKVFYDRETAQVSLAATQRCILAALIRSATLPRESLLAHITDPAVMLAWDRAAGDRIANTLADRAGVDSVTKSLVTAMDWGSAGSEMLDRYHAEDVVRKTLHDSHSSSFPVLPGSLVTMMAAASTSGAVSPNFAEDEDWAPLYKAAPPGRLLSLLFVRMGAARSAPSMANIWTVFCHELRQRWDDRDSLPHMNHIPGLDPPLGEYTAAAQQQRRCFSTVGATASLAGQINSSEPDPDINHCLIGQKLQVFNICIESIVKAEKREMDEMQRRLNDSMKSNVGSEDDHDWAPPPMPSKTSSVASSIGEGTSMPPSDYGIQGTNSREASMVSNRFHGYVNGRSSRSIMDDDTASVNTNITGYFDAEQDMESDQKNVARQSERQGERCPIHGVSLVANGNQLYAPYLQRPYPLTDDEIASRKMMLSRQRGAKASSTVRQRLEITHRFQKPKLLSDIRAFKAANPGAVFQDFVAWYGNPIIPLELDDPGSSTLELGAESMKKKLDNAVEAIRVLEETRMLWTDTWNIADACPALEQEPLFDAANLAEMALDHLETIHPANLVCQVLAVNLAMSYFCLATCAGEAAKVSPVAASLTRLRKAVENSLDLLMKDSIACAGSVLTPKTVTPTMAQAMDGTSKKKKVAAGHSTAETRTSVATVESIAACGKACMALSEAEVLVSRSTSLLHKLPRQYQFVETILSQSDGVPVALQDRQGRDSILHAIHDQQQGNTTTTIQQGHNGSSPKPSIREYLYRNRDDSRPCQLCVRHGDPTYHPSTMASNDSAGLIVAITKTARQPS